MQVPGQPYSQPQQPYPQQPMTATHQQAAIPQQPTMQIQQPAIATQSAQPQAMAVTTSVSTGNYKWLAQGETIRADVSGIMGFVNPNPLLRMIVAVATFVMLIIGFRAKASLVITNHRVVLDVRNYALWIIETGCDTITLTKPREIVTGFNSTLLIFKKKYIGVDNYLVGVKSNTSMTEIESMATLIKDHV
tara:strand:+ start:937 stop:1509 length:573 start_codon:yes stop_codon:yes gene_type:complete